MAESGLDESKDSLIQAITEDYAHGLMDVAAFERAVTRIHASGDRTELANEAAALGLALLVSVRDPREAFAPPTAAPTAGSAVGEALLSCVSGSIRKTGDWVRQLRYKLELKSASVRLDLTEYEGARGFRLALEIDAISSSVRIIVPEGFQVEDRFAENRSSTVRNKPKSGNFGDNLILLTGALRSSTVKIKYH